MIRQVSENNPSSSPGVSPRYHALDSVRAIAMMMGILYHALLFGGGMGGMFGGNPGPNVRLMDWLHSFRMAMFFMVGGFFSAMMFRKYPVGKYLARRWWRLGGAMVVYLFVLVGINQLTGSSGGFGGFGPPGGPRGNGGAPPARFTGPGTFPAPNPGAAGSMPGQPANPAEPGESEDFEADGPPPFGGPGGGPGMPGFGGPSGGPGGPGFGGPGGPGGFGPGMFIAGSMVSQADTNRDQLVSAQEFVALADAWFDKLDSDRSGKVSQQQFVTRFGEILASDRAPGPGGGGERGGVGPGPGGGPGGFNPAIFLAPGLFTALDANKDGSVTRVEVTSGFAKWYADWDADKSNGLTEDKIRAGLNKVLPGPSFGGRGGMGGPGGRPGGFGGGSPIADRLFGSLARQLGMGPMWFLWFLIVFATVGPVVSWLVAWTIRNPLRERLDGVVRFALKWSLAPLCLAVICIPALWLAGTSPGRPPDGMTAIAGTFPDVLMRYHPDWPYFFAYFMSGWLLFRYRESLDELARFWLPCLVIGLAAHVLSRSYQTGGGPFAPMMDIPATARLSGYLVFAISATFTSFAFVGFFQKYLNRPGRISRYLADMAFWFYLLHQELLVRVVLPRLRPYDLSWWLQTTLALAIVMGVGAITFEIFIRRTPLTNLFGPPAPRKPRPQPQDSAIPQMT